MFIRKVFKKNQGFDKKFFYLHLVESVWTPKGPRQKLILNLGAIDIPEDKFSELAQCIEDKLSGNNHLFDVSVDENIAQIAQTAVSKLVKKNATPIVNAVTIDSENKSSTNGDLPATNSYTPIDEQTIKVENVRTIGTENICLDALKHYQLDKFFERQGINQDTISCIYAQIVSRMTFPGSDLSSWEWLNDKSGLFDLMHKPDKFSLSTFYRSADLIWDLKSEVENHLKSKSDELFQLKRKLCLLDLTNTYFEGSMNKVPMAKRGRSKEKRSDLKLITIGLMIDENGFPEKSLLFEGNISEPTSLKKMLDLLDIPAEQEKPTVLMDAGIGTKDNVEYLISQGFSYIVVSRRDSTAVKKEEMQPMKVSKCGNAISTKRVVDESGEVLLYCHSTGKEAKEDAIVSRQVLLFTEALQKLREGLSKKTNTKDYAKINVAIGRLRQKYTKASTIYDVIVTPDENKKDAIDIKWEKNQKNQRDSGVYLLRTDRKNLSDEEIWDTYITLTRIEKTFKTIKSDVGLRPAFHQTESRVEAHVFITLIAYHLINAIEYKLRLQNDLRSWDTIRETMQNHTAITVQYNYLEKDGQKMKKFLRTCTEPEECHKQIYHALDMGTPRFPKIQRNFNT